MLDFRPILISDKDEIKSIFSKKNFAGSEYSFVNNYIWSKVYDIKISMKAGFYVVKVSNGKYTGFSFPVGEGNIASIINDVIEYCSHNNIEFIMSSINQDSKELMESVFGNKFIFIEDRNSFDYIYLSEKLATLTGKKFHSKRNHINRFLENNWYCEKITKSNIDLCFEMNKEWIKMNDSEKDEGKRLEIIAANTLLENFFDLESEGIILKVDDKIVAYTIGEQLNNDTFIVHLEKAFSNIQGAYPMINREFAKQIFENGFKYINREEDLGIEGLRKAKLSYQPDILYKKYIARIKK